MEKPNFDNSFSAQSISEEWADEIADQRRADRQGTYPNSDSLDLTTPKSLALKHIAEIKKLLSDLISDK